MVTTDLLPPKFLANAWEVLVLFLIPIGGGIPAGVILAKARGLTWPIMVVLYFISDIILACLFEPLLKLIVWAGKRSKSLARFNAAVKESMGKTVAKYGVSPGPFALIMISFGADPMTGRSAAFAAGHNFFSGWALAIAGDMVFFSILMVSTLWLNNLLGDGTMTAIIILVAMTVAPMLIRKIRQLISPARA